MPNVSFGRITVPSAGTPIQLTVNITAPKDPQNVQVHAVLIQPHPSNTGKVYIGKASNFTKNGANQIAWLPPPGANTAPAFSETVSFAPNAIQCAEFWIDVDNNGDSVIASGVIL